MSELGLKPLGNHFVISPLTPYVQELNISQIVLLIKLYDEILWDSIQFNSISRKIPCILGSLEIL
jgi:hypothetical protein